MDGYLATSAVRFRYARLGSGPPVVLLPGSGGWRLTFDRLARRLAADYTVIAVDPPGQGGTRVMAPSFPYDTNAVADALEEFIATIVPEPVPIAGHSWGGGFALRLAERHPHRVERLVLLAPAGLVVRDVWEFRIMRRRGIGELALPFTSTATVGHMIRKSFAHRDREPSRALIAAAAREIRSSPALRRDLLRIERGIDWATTERDLGAVTCPALVVWGDRDRYFPVQLAQRLTSRLPDAQLVIVEGAGHSVHDDAPGTVDAAIALFLAK